MKALPLQRSSALLLVAALATCRPAAAPGDLIPAYDPSGLEPRVAAKLLRVEAALVESQDSAAAWGRLGMVFQAHALYPQSVACYRQAAGLEPGDYRWPYLTALSLAGSDLSAAIESFELAVALEPANEAVYVGAAEASSETGDLGRAADMYRKALAVAPGSPYAHLGLGRLALGAGEIEESRIHLEKALAAERRSGEAHRLLAGVHQRLGNDELAADHQEHAGVFTAVLRPRDPARAEVTAEAVNSRSYTDRGRTFAAQGRFADAERQFREVLKIRAPNFRDLTNLGGALAGQGRLDEAIELYRQALALDPDDAVAHNNLGMALAEKGELVAAEGELRSALELDSRYGDASKNLGLLLAQSGRPEEAVDALRRAIELDPSLVSARNDLAVALERLDRGQEALTVWREALRFGPDDPSILYNLSLALIKMGVHGEAIEHMRHGLRVAPNSSRFASLLAWELATAPTRELRDGPEALQLARRVAGAYPQDPSVTDILAAALAETGDHAAAAQAAEHALTLTRRAGNLELAGEISKRLDLYRRGRPFRQPRRQVAEIDSAFE